MAFVLKNKNGLNLTIDQRVNLAAETLLKEATGKTTMAWLLGDDEPSKQLDDALAYYNGDDSKKLFLTMFCNKEITFESSSEAESLLRLSHDLNLSKLNGELSIVVKSIQHYPESLSLAEVS